MPSPEVIPKDERRLQDSPQTKVRALLHSCQRCTSRPPHLQGARSNVKQQDGRPRHVDMG